MQRNTPRIAVAAVAVTGVVFLAVWVVASVLAPGRAPGPPRMESGSRANRPVTALETPVRSAPTRSAEAFGPEATVVETVDAKGLARAFGAVEACVQNDPGLAAAVVEVGIEAISSSETQIVGAQIHAAAGEVSDGAQTCVDDALLDLVVVGRGTAVDGDSIWITVDDEEGSARSRLQELLGTPPRDQSVDLDAPSLEAHRSRFDLAKRGAENAEVEVAVCASFDCPFSQQAAKALANVLEAEDRVGLVYLHGNAAAEEDERLSARAAIVAEAQGAFWPMHDLLFARPEARTESKLLALAAEVGLDADAVAKAMWSPETQARLDADAAFCTGHGARGTPTFFVDDDLVEGTRSVEEIAALVRQALEDG